VTPDSIIEGGVWVVFGRDTASPFGSSVTRTQNGCSTASSHVRTGADMSAYLPSRKVIAAALMAVVGTIVLVASGNASPEAITAVWAPVAAAYTVNN
jgi:hypothetical protein